MVIAINYNTILACIVTATVASLLTLSLMNNKSPATCKYQCGQISSQKTLRESGLVDSSTQPNKLNLEDERSLINKKKPGTLLKRVRKLITLKDAVKSGAVCLDGSPPAYYWREGVGKGVNKWIIHLAGGAWCYDEVACYQRVFNRYGSTRYEFYLPNGGILSTNETSNPDFHDWNTVFVLYCDGSSFTGMREKPIHVNGKALYFRGKLVLDFVMSDLLLNRGLRDAKEVLLTGSSAGSLAALIHADYIKSLLPTGIKMLVVSDAGYFVDMKSSRGDLEARRKFASVVRLHNSTGALHSGCVKHTNPKKHWKCMFPQYFFKYIETPVFVLQAALDFWQIMSSLNMMCVLPNYEIISSLFKENGFRVSENYTRGSPSARESAKKNSHGDSVASESRNSRGHSLPRDSHNSHGDSVTRESRTSREHSLTRESHALDVLALENTRSEDTRRNLLPQNDLNNAKTVSKPKDFQWHWKNSYSGPAECTKSELEAILGLHATTADALVPVVRKSGAGLFLSPCFEHTQAVFDILWNTVTIRGKTIRQAVGDWFNGRPGNHIYIGEYLSFKTCVP